MHSYNLSLIVAVFALNFFLATGNDVDYYKKMRRKNTQLFEQTRDNYCLAHTLRRRNKLMSTFTNLKIVGSGTHHMAVKIYNGVPNNIKEVGKDSVFYKLAIDCTNGPKSWKDPDAPCNTCNCLSDGVVVCTRMKCNINDGPGNVYEPEDVPGPEDEPEPQMAPETEEVDSQNGNAKVLAVYKQLRDDATGCNPGEKVSRDKCAGCICILPGVMRCTNVQCLAPEGPKDDKLRDLGTIGTK